jgi:hypothetical protein
MEYANSDIASFLSEGLNTEATPYRYVPSFSRPYMP